MRLVAGRSPNLSSLFVEWTYRGYAQSFRVCISSLGSYMSCSLHDAKNWKPGTYELEVQALIPGRAYNVDVTLQAGNRSSNSSVTAATSITNLFVLYVMVYSYEACTACQSILCYYFLRPEDVYLTIRDLCVVQSHRVPGT